MSDEQRIHATAVNLIETLETPIRGRPTITVHDRATAERFVAAAFRAIFEALTEKEETT